ncbi:MAG: hypothetical protein ACOYCD_02495 [Kiritimatiellia bacterium]|jgi:hypothetical protein
MKRYLKCTTLCAAVLLSLHTAVLSSPADSCGRVEGEVVVIKQEQLSVWQPGESFSERIGAASLEGTDIALDRLPATVRANLEYMATRVVPRFEFSAVDPKDVIRFLVRRPKQKNMIRLGLVSEHQDSEPDPPWLKDLQVGSNKLSCTLTNASVLDIYVLLAESLDCEFGITQNGEALFRNRTQPARAKHPAYIVKRK